MEPTWTNTDTIADRRSNRRSTTVRLTKAIVNKIAAFLDRNPGHGVIVRHHGCEIGVTRVTVLRWFACADTGNGRTIYSPKDCTIPRTTLANL